MATIDSGMYARINYFTFAHLLWISLFPLNFTTSKYYVVFDCHSFLFLIITTFVPTFAPTSASSVFQTKMNAQNCIAFAKFFNSIYLHSIYSIANIIRMKIWLANTHTQIPKRKHAEYLLLEIRKCLPFNRFDFDWKLRIYPNRRYKSTILLVGIF